MIDLVKFSPRRNGKSLAAKVAAEILPNIWTSPQASTFYVDETEMFSDRFNIQEEMVREAAGHVARGHRVRFVIAGKTVGHYPALPIAIWPSE